MLTRRQLVTGLTSGLAFSQIPQLRPAFGGSTKSAEEARPVIRISTGLDDSNSMGERVPKTPFTRRQCSLQACANAISSQEVRSAIKSLEKGTIIWFDMYFWANTIMPFISPVAVSADNPDEGLQHITQKLLKEAEKAFPPVNMGTFTSVGIRNGIERLMDPLGGTPAYRKVLNIYTDDDERESSETDIAVLQALKMLAHKNDIILNGLILGNGNANDRYFHNNLKEGYGSFVIGTDEYPDESSAWRQKICLDLS